MLIACCFYSPLVYDPLFWKFKTLIFCRYQSRREETRIKDVVEEVVPTEEEENNPVEANRLIEMGEP